MSQRNEIPATKPTGKHSVKDRAKIRRRAVPLEELEDARETARRQVSNAIKRDLLLEHMAAITASKDALFALWNHEGLDPDAVDPHDARTQLLMALDREHTRATIAYSGLTDDAYGVSRVKESNSSRQVLYRRAFEELECAPEYERGSREPRDVARRRAESAATLRVLVERGVSLRAAAAALDPSLAEVRSRELPPAKAKAAQRALARRRSQFQDRLDQLLKRRAQCEVDDGGPFGNVRRLALPSIDAAITWLRRQMSQLDK